MRGTSDVGQGETAAHSDLSHILHAPSGTVAELDHMVALVDHVDDVGGGSREQRQRSDRSVGESHGFGYR